MSVEFPKPVQFSGCLVGQCLADAVGVPVEQHAGWICEYYVASELRMGCPNERRSRNRVFGQYSDDSQLARELIQSFVARRQFDPVDYGSRIAAIVSEHRLVGGGLATKSAAKRLARGIPWDQAGTPSPRASNGAAMRAAPIGLIYFDDLHALQRAAIDQGRCTHLDPRSLAGAIAVAGAVSLALRPGPVDTASFLHRLSELTENTSPLVAQALLSLVDFCSFDIPVAREAIIATATDYLESGGGGKRDGISSYVIDSLLWSLYSFLRSPNDYWETICTSITPGGDVDTTAAMAGAISGAHLGIDALPDRLAQRVTDNGTWGFTELVSLADACYAIAIAHRKQGG